MRIVQLMASPFFGGPEKQMLGLARHLPASYETAFCTFAERGLSRAPGRGATPRFCGPYADAQFPVRSPGRAGIGGPSAVPECRRGLLQRLQAGHRWLAGGGIAGVRVVSVSHGWTAATWKVRLYEAADKWLLRFFDAVVCVSEGQAVKVRRAGVPEEKVAVIRNAIDLQPDEQPIDVSFREKLLGLFPSKPRLLVGAAGRLSPEKGFATLVEAAALVSRQHADVGFVLFGDGPLREL